MNPPLPSEISAFKPPSPSEFPVTFRGGGMDIFWNHTLSEYGKVWSRALLSTASWELMTVLRNKTKRAKKMSETWKATWLP